MGKVKWLGECRWECGWDIGKARVYIDCWILELSIVSLVVYYINVILWIIFDSFYYFV